MKHTALLLFMFAIGCFSGVAQLSFSEKNIDLGAIAEAYEIKGNLVIKNLSPAKTFLMRADAEPGLKVYTSKRTLLAGDTCLLVLSFVPESSGKFNKKIKLVTSDKAQPYELTLSGNLNRLKSDDKTACYYFGSRKPNPVAVNTTPLIVPETTAPRDNTNRLPDHAPPEKKPVAVTPTVAPKPKAQPDPNSFSEADYKPNNILFLVDVSSSMRDSLKLPLMKRALHVLINEARNIDTITFVTYAVKVNVIKEAVSGADKAVLHALVDSLKAKGTTSGNKAIHVSQQLAQKHFISGGNNQIILASDGEFKFTPEDQQLWKQQQAGRKIILTTVAFGEDKPALKNLRSLAGKGDGSFIHIEHGSGSEKKLLDEIKQRSRK